MPLRVPPGDDAAVLQDGTVLTTDLLIEGVHFDDRLVGADVGWKAVAVSVSDIAAMGARPTWMLLDLAVADPEGPWVQGFVEGLGAAADAFGVDLIGGDTTRSHGARVVNITLAGRAPGPVLRRDGGRPGDTLYVTGIPGLAGAGYLLDAPGDAARAALARPTPPVAFAVDAASLAHAAMDLSDGLAADLPRLCTASSCGARLEPRHLPDHPDLHGPPGSPPARTLALAAGDDYLLLLAAPSAADGPLRDLAARHGVRLTAVGTLTEDPALVLTDGDWPVPPWRHFGKGA